LTLALRCERREVVLDAKDKYGHGGDPGVVYGMGFCEAKINRSLFGLLNFLAFPNLFGPGVQRFVTLEKSRWKVIASILRMADAIIRA